jgi:hypothetical protein
MVSYFLSHLGIVNWLMDKLDQATQYASQALSLRREIDLELWTTADLTTLAAIQCSVGDMDAASDHIQQALTILDECDGQGPECPQRDYFMCYHVLQAIEQTETAHKALQSAHRLVMDRAETITDPSLRQSFLEQVPINQQIVQEAQRLPDQ